MSSHSWLISKSHLRFDIMTFLLIFIVQKTAMKQAPPKKGTKKSDSQEGKQMEKLNFSGGGVQRDFFFVYVWREWELLIQLTAWIWHGLRPRLVCSAGRFPERAAQGRGTCGSLRHWLRGWWDGKMFGSSRKWTCAGSMKPSGKTE